jgi:hypothetical protein
VNRHLPIHQGMLAPCTRDREILKTREELLGNEKLKPRSSVSLSGGGPQHKSFAKRQTKTNTDNKTE